MNYQSTKILNHISDELNRHFGKTLESASKEDLYQACAMCIKERIMDRWTHAKASIDKNGEKMLIYMSAEFLMGRALGNNLINLGLLHDYQQALKEIGIDLAEIEAEEDDAALGNGGLGRLAACFLDSLSTLQLPAMGCGIRYEHGLFKQRIFDGQQVEIEDEWLRSGHVWEVLDSDDQVEIHFGGEIKEHWTADGLKIEHYNYHTVLAVPYDMPIIGYESKMPVTLRLWSARAKQNLDMTYFNRGDYRRAMEEKELAEVISKVLYPEDNHDAGRQLRLKQFYFFTSATMQSIVQRHKRLYGDLHTLPDYIEVQINDTHPTLAIPELMRILMDEEGFGWDEAFSVVSHMFNYTNHTILSEALECWPKDMFQLLLPRIFSIIQVINEKYCQQLWNVFPGEFEKISNLAIVAYNEIRMANLCLAVCKKINGVSGLHGKILKTSLFRDQYIASPEKFLAITNGVTHRRWLAKANPGLTQLMKARIGDGFLKDYRQFEKILPYAKDPEFQAQFALVKQENKKRLQQYMLEKQGIHLMDHAIYDVHAKRLHEYKRQLLKTLHILYLYHKIKQDAAFYMQPTVFIFAAKASPGYVRAKNIIHLIQSVATLVNNDPDTKEILQVVFLENYNVSSAEILIPATDISEQISTAGKEASGTGNMKFMMNGAITLGTMDGANVEIYEQVGAENIFIFGASSQELAYAQKYHTYNPGTFYEKDPDIRATLNQLVDHSLQVEAFSELYQSLLFGDAGRADQYFLLYDFRSYVEAFARVTSAYQNVAHWNEMAITNVAKSGIFSSDRTIEEYNQFIWHIAPYLKAENENV